MGLHDGLAPDDSVRVNEEDCIYAVKANQFQCAIVRAVWRKYPEARRVRVNKNTIAFSIGEERFVYPTPETAVESIIKPLDTGGAPEPGLVRLKAGIVKPVEHKEDRNAATQAERDRRATAIRERILDNSQGKSDYARYNNG